MMRRRLLVGSAIASLAIASDALWIEPNRVTVERHTIGNSTAGGPLLRIVQLSDLHLQQIASHEQRVARSVRELTPDLVVLTGDSIDRADRLDTLGEFLELLPKGTPSYAILGNWEHWAAVDSAKLAQAYETHGSRLLINQSVRLEHHGHRLLVTGLDDSTGGHPDLTAALDGVPPTSNHLFLGHSPAYRDSLPNRLQAEQQRMGVMLSGHTHGGQIALLGYAPYRPPGSGRYRSGWYRDRWPHLYVSRGIGTSVVPLRFGSPPEIAVFDWYLQR